MKLVGLGKIRSIVIYILYVVIVVLIFDIVLFKHLLGFGYPWSYEEEKILRSPAPYVMFTAKPGVQGHNEFGFRGASLKEAAPGDIKIAFFGGSTGYGGDPPIPSIIEKELGKLLDRDVFVANYSVVSSNHRQHLHGIIEYIPDDKPDLVIFYGGYNETVQSSAYDPRPGYPYNFFYRSETSPIIKVILENSAIAGELDKEFGLFSGIRKLRMEHTPYSDNWNSKILEKYFETLERALNVTSSIESSYCNKTKFLAFYQPFQVPEEFQSTHERIKHRLSTTPYAFDVSSEFDGIRKDIYIDIVHVKQEARELMGRKIAAIIADELLSGKLNCHLEQ